MKAGKKIFLAGILAAVMIAGGSITVLAAEASQIPEESSQSVTQQDEQSTERKAKKTKTSTDGESNASEDGTEKGRHQRKGMIPRTVRRCRSTDITARTLLMCRQMKTALKSPNAKFSKKASQMPRRILKKVKMYN